MPIIEFRKNAGDVDSRLAFTTKRTVRRWNPQLSPRTPATRLTSSTAWPCPSLRRHPDRESGAGAGSGAI